MRNENNHSRDPLPDLQEIVRRAESGDENALLELYTILEFSEIWDQASSLERQMREMWIGVLADKDLFRRETIERRVAEMRREMAGPGSSALERLLADRILCAWLVMLYANAMSVRYQRTGAEVM